MSAYYELSWAILSTIGLLNICFGLMVLGITGFSRIALVPIVVSAAGALANGLCYYAFYADYPRLNSAVASAFADLAWLVQEAGLSFYSYLILSRILQNKSRLVFFSLFWFLMVVICVIRIVILVSRLRYILDGSTSSSLQKTIDNLHMGYFASIAAVEGTSAFFLLRRFSSARSLSLNAALKVGLFSYLMRSTEVRVALLAVIGTTRVITYSFQTTIQSATTTASQFDRFAYTMECMFPVIMFIDILASRLVFANSSYGTSSRSGGRGQSSNRAVHHPGDGTSEDVPMYPMPRAGNRVEVQGGLMSRTKTADTASSQDHIIEEGSLPSRAASGINNYEPPDMHSEGSGITKTVVFQVLEGGADMS